MLHHKAVNKHGVFFGLHLYRRPEEPVFYSCLGKAAKLLRKHGYKLDYGMTWGDPYIQKSRDELVAKFLKSDCNTFFFIADDLEYTAKDMLKVIETPGEFVVGAYSMHVKPANYPVLIHVDSDKKAITRKDGCISTKFAQTGFMRVNRIVFEKIANAHPELECYGMKDGKKTASTYDFFPQGVSDHLWIGEDYAFCKLWTDLGKKIWLVPDLNLTHYLKGKGYPGNFHEYLMRLPGGCKENE